MNLRSDKPIRVPADLAGFKMRMPPGPAFQTIAQALGAVSVAMPATEMYLALKTGAIDAHDNPTNMTRDWKLQEVTSQVVLTRHLVQPLFVAIAKPVFDKLTPAQQAELRAATLEAIDIQIGKSAKDELDALETFKAAKLKKRDYTVDWVHLKLNDQAQRTVLCKDPFLSVDERVERLIASM